MIRYIGDFSALCAEKSPPAGIMRSSGEDFGSPGGGFGSSGAGFSSVGPFWARRVEVSARQLRVCLRTSIRLACPRIPAGCVLALDVPSRHAFGLRPCQPGADDPLTDRTGVLKQALRPGSRWRDRQIQTAPVPTQAAVP